MHKLCLLNFLEYVYGLKQNHCPKIICITKDQQSFTYSIALYITKPGHCRAKACCIFTWQEPFCFQHASQQGGYDCEGKHSMMCRPAEADENTRKRPASKIEPPAAQEARTEGDAMTADMTGIQPQQLSSVPPVGLPGSISAASSHEVQTLQDARQITPVFIAVLRVPAILFCLRMSESCSSCAAAYTATSTGEVVTPSSSHSRCHHACQYLAPVWLTLLSWTWSRPLCLIQPFFNHSPGIVTKYIHTGL